MVYATQEWVRGLELPRAPKTVLAALATHQNRKSGDCFPGHETLAKDTGYSLRSVRRHVSWLRNAGLINVTHRAPGGVRKSDSYTFNVEWTAEPTGQTDRVPTGQTDQWPNRPVAKKDNPTGQKVQSVPLYIEPEEEPEEVNAQRDLFAEFWIVWPRSESKKPAAEAWAKAIKRADPEKILAAANAYANHPDRVAKRFVPYAATWLNQDRWTDPLPEADEPQHRASGPQANLEYLRRMQQQQGDQKGIA